MPPLLALLACSAFVVLLLRLERQETPSVSLAVWIPTLWMLAIASKSLAIWFGMAGNNESGSLPDRLLLTGLTVAALVVLVRRRYDWSGALRRHGWLLALLAYMLVSTLWSDITFVSLKRWVRDGIVVIMALVVMSEHNPREALGSLLRRSAYILIPFSLLLIKYYPTLGVDYARWSGMQMWVGVTVQKNTLGRLCLISAFFLLWSLYRRWRERAPAAARYQGWADASVLFIALYLLKGDEGAYSATSLGTIAVGIVSFVGLTSLRRLKIPIPKFGLLGLVVFLIAFGAAAPFLGGSNVATFSSTFGRTETLTGRTETWAALVPVVMRHPLLGSGFGSFWTTTRRDFYQMSHGHNGYLDILLELGGVGLAIYIGWLLSCARKLHRALAEDYEWASLAICLLVMALVYNVTESALSSLAEQMTAVVALASLVVPYERICGPRRSHLRVHLHLPPQRDVGTSPAQLGPPALGRPVPILHRHRGQRRWGARPRNGCPGAGGTGS